MLDNIDPKKHLSFTSAAEMRQIIQPLKDYLGIEGLHFTRFYKQSEPRKRYIFNLDTHPRALWETVKHFITIDTRDVLPPMGRFRLFLPEVESIANTTMRVKFEEQIRIQVRHGLGTEIAIPRDHAHYFDLFDFAPPAHCPRGASYLVPHVEELDHFINYFYEKAAHLLEQGEHNHFILKREPLYVPEVQPAAPCSREAFLKATQVKQFHFVNPLGQRQTLTKREWQCAKRLQDGYTAKQIGRSLGISPRTAEIYIDKLKHKFECLSRQQLLERLAPLTFPLEQ